MLAFETKNNKAKMARWTAAALLAGADMMKLGYVSRAGPRDNMNHIILGTQVRACLIRLRKLQCSAVQCSAGGRGCTTSLLCDVMAVLTAGRVAAAKFADRC